MEGLDYFVHNSNCCASYSRARSDRGNTVYLVHTIFLIQRCSDQGLDCRLHGHMFLVVRKRDYGQPVGSRDSSSEGPGSCFFHLALVGGRAGASKILGRLINYLYIHPFHGGVGG